MKNIIQSISILSLGIVLATGNTGCKKDFTNPSAATSDQVLSSAKGLAGTAVGLQRVYANNVAYGFYDANGLVTNETILMNAGNTSEFQLDRKSTRLNSSHEWISRMPSSA